MTRIVYKALAQLSYQYDRAEVFRVFGDTADGEAKRLFSYRKALRIQALGIVEHDRILNSR